MTHSVIFKRLLVWGTPVLGFVAWEEWLRWERAVWEVLIILTWLEATAVWYLTKRSVGVSSTQKRLHHNEYWRFLISPLTFVWMTSGYIMILENWWWQQIIIVGATVCGWLVLANIADRFMRSASYPPQSFETLSTNLNAVTIFFAATVAYSWIALLNTSVWVMALALLVVLTALTYQTLWIAGLSLARAWLAIIVIDLLFVELFWVLLWLPNTYYVKALLLLVGTYITINVCRNQLLGILTPTMVRRYLLIATVIVGLVVLTAQWG